MSKANKEFLLDQQQESAFEMIELAVGGLDVLARAFDVIAEVCRESEAPQVSLLETPPRELIN